MVLEKATPVGTLPRDCEDLKPLVLIPVRDKVLGMPNSAQQFICFAEIIVQ